jgi:hypothetical protein
VRDFVFATPLMKKLFKWVLGIAEIIGPFLSCLNYFSVTLKLNRNT